jgi:serine/threonine-protein kinase
MTPGTKLGPYEIVAPLGAGGMGEVYRARDPRMGREVAIKISAERFSDRFEREVRAVAALNHTNICQIYDVGPNYLVMELVEGPTLAERLKAGALPLDEALAIARQIGDALEAAHEKGIVHRDLKPANIKIKPDGTVKVLDFGLAKVAQASAREDPEASPTLTIQGTVAGQILGTAAYMAPEQARGKTVDKRADIWAFGVVLYEMLTGRRLFEGETIPDTLIAVLKEDPDWNRVPAKVQRLLQSCLEKDPKRRLRDIADAWRLLDDAPVQVGSNTRLPWAVAAVLALALAVTLIWPWRGAVPPADHPATRLDLDLGPDVSLGSSIGPAVILSPDGTRMVLVSLGSDGFRRLFTRRLDQTKTTLMPGTEGAYEPFFSPDGQWVGFFGQGKLKKTRIDGGEPVSLCNAPAGRGASWADDDTIIAALDSQTPLSRVQAEGGDAAPLTDFRADLGEFTHRWPHALPGGKAVLFTASTRYANFGDADVAAVTLRDRHRKTVLEHGGMFPHYLASGFLAYVTKGTLFAVPFDAERLEVRGAPTTLQEVPAAPNLGFAQFDFSRSGTVAYLTGRTQGLRTLQWLEAAGRIAELRNEPSQYVSLRLSPDSKRLAAIVSQYADSGLWVYDLERGTKTLLTKGIEADGNPVWSPDGRFLVFRSAGGMFWTRSDAGGNPQPLTRSGSLQLPSSFSPDGTRLSFAQFIPAGGGEIRTVPVESASGQLRAGEPQTFLKTPTINTFATFSPDGRWLAFTNAEGGNYEVYVRAFPDNGTQVQISNAGGVIPIWSRNGRELFYRTEDQRIMVASYAVKDGLFVASKPRVWFEKQLANTGLTINYDLAPDGKRFAVLMPAKGQETQENQRHVMLSVNFFDEVRRRVGGPGK